MFFIKFKVTMNIYKRPHVQKTSYACNRVYILFSTSVELSYPYSPSGVFGLPKVTENGSKDFLDFLHNDSEGKMKMGSRARFSRKNLILAIFEFLGSKYPKIKVFATLRENGSNDFAHFAYLDRSHQYLQLLY